MGRSTEIYFGRNVLKEALEARRSVLEIFVETRSAYEWLKTIPSMKFYKGKVEEGIPKSVSKEAHQGVAFRTNHEFYEVIESLKLADHDFVVLTNHVEDVHNLGSIVRCGAAFGASLLIHEKDHSASMTGAALKASAGCAFRLGFSKVESLANVMVTLRSAGFEIAALDATSKSVSLFDWAPKKKVALVLGSEGEGLDAEVKAACQTLVRIPMKGSVDSLNVSHAAGIAMNWIAQKKA